MQQRPRRLSSGILQLYPTSSSLRSPVSRSQYLCASFDDVPLFAGIRDEVAAASIERIVALFPTQAASFESSFGGSLLLQLAKYCWILNIPLDNLKECHRSVDLARAALKVLATMTFESEAKSLVLEEVPEEFEGIFVTKRSKQKDRKKAKRATRTISIDTKPFDQLRVDVPNSQDAALALEKGLLDDQKQVLRVWSTFCFSSQFSPSPQHYLKVLRISDYAGLFKKAYIKEVTMVDALSQNGSTAQTDNIASDTAPVVSVPSAFPHVQPIKAAFYFDSVQGFGDWRILISTRADRNLREAKRSDKNHFRIILKKIKFVVRSYLSNVILIV